MYKLSLLFVACAALAPFVSADSIVDVCGTSNQGTFCSKNATTLISCASRREVACGVNEFCQVQGPKIARCEPITKDADQVCETAASQGLKSAIRCSNDVANVRISCPNALISRCPSGKVCVQSNSRYARCEAPAFTSEFVVVETFVADVEPLPVSHAIPITATTFLPTTTTIALTETIVTTPELATTTLGMQTDSGFPTTLPNIQTVLVPINRTMVGMTTIIIPTTTVHSDMSTILQTVTQTVEPTEIPMSTPIQTITNTLTQTVLRPRTTTQILSTTQGFITEVETISMSSTIVEFPTLATTPLLTLTETVVETPTFTLVPTEVPDLTLTVTETAQLTPTIISTPYVTMTSTEVPPTVQTVTEVSTETAVYPSVIIVPTTDLFTYTATQEVINVLPTTVVDMSTPVLQATPLVTLAETNAVTFTPTFTAVLPTSEVMTSLYTSAVPGTAILSQTAIQTDVATWTNMATIVSEASSTVAVPLSTLIPTIATDTFIVCHTPVPTFSQGIPTTYGLTLTADPVPVTASPIVTRTRGPDVQRTQTTVIAGIPTMSSNDDNIPIFGLFNRYAVQGQPAMIKVEGACTTSYRVKFGYSAAPVTATDINTYPVTTVNTAVAHETSFATNVAYQTDIITAETLPITVPYTSNLGVFTTAYPEAPTHTLDVVQVIEPTIIEYTPAPVHVTEVGLFTTTMAYPTQIVVPSVNTYTQVDHLTEQLKSTVIAYVPITQVEEPISTAFITEVPTLTATLPALTTYLPTVTSTMPAPTTAAPSTTVDRGAVTSVASYVTKLTKVYTNIGVNTQTSILASPTVISTVNVFPPIVQVTVTATATADEPEATTSVSTWTSVSASTLTAEVPQSSTMTRVSSATSVQTAVYTATSTQVHASTFVSTRTFDAVPTGNLFMKPRLEKTNVSVIDVSTNTVVVKQQPPATQVSSVYSTSTGVVTVTSVVQSPAQATGGPVIADASSSASIPIDASGSSAVNATTTINRVSTVTATSTFAAPQPTFTIMPFPMGSQTSSEASTGCPTDFAVGNSQYRITAPGTEADGEAACAAFGNGWVLADISDAAEHEAIGNSVCAATYYRSWLNNDYGDACLTMYPGGATVVPAQGCTAIFPSLCKLEA